MRLRYVRGFWNLAITPALWYGNSPHPDIVHHWLHLQWLHGCITLAWNTKP